jgi:hypothetical protein
MPVYGVDGGYSVGMAVETGLITRAVSTIFSVVSNMRKRSIARRWVGNWEAYSLVGRDLTEPMKGAGPATVSLPRWWKFSSKLTFGCSDCDEQGQPTRHQTGHLFIDPNDPDAASRVGRYVDSAEVYEQRLRMLDNDTILIIPIPEQFNTRQRLWKTWMASETIGKRCPPRIVISAEKRYRSLLCLAEFVAEVRRIRNLSFVWISAPSLSEVSFAS